MTKPKVRPLTDEDEAYIRANFKLVDGQLYRLHPRRHAIWKPCPGYKAKEGYRMIHIQHRTMSAHRIVWFVKYNVNPTELDHIDGNPSNNHPNNLREATPRENSQNLKLHRKGKPQGSNKKRNKFAAKLYANKQHVYLGSYNTELEANNVYQTACDNLHLLKQDKYAFANKIRTLCNLPELTNNKNPLGYSYHQDELKPYKVGLSHKNNKYHCGSYYTKEDAINAKQQAQTFKDTNPTTAELKEFCANLTTSARIQQRNPIRIQQRYPIE